MAHLPAVSTLPRRGTLRAAAPAAGFAALIAALLAWICLHPEADLLRDDVWMMRVMDRMLSGDILYRDISFGATPLSLYAMVALGRLWGVELLAVRAVVAVAFCLALWWCLEAAGLLGAGSRGRMLLAAGLIAFAIPAWSSAYSLLATAFLSGCLTATLRWQQNGLQRHAVLAGILCGLAFSSKQNVGLAALAALAASLAAGNWPGRRVRAGLLAFAGFAAATGVCLFPVAASGAWAKFVEYGFTGKGAYVRLASLSYIDTLLELNRLSDWLRKPAFLAPAVLLPLCFLWLRAVRAKRPPATAVFAFSLAAIAGIYPRPDWWHLQPQLPILAVGIVYAASHWNAPPFLRTAAQAILIAGAAASLAKPFAEAAQEGYVLASLPHFRGVLMPPEAREETRDRAARLKQAVPEGEVFLLFPDASVYYLLSGLRNPTPFDYPYLTTLGIRGEDELIDAIGRGRIGTVCVGAGADKLPLIPLKLLRHVERNMRQAADLGFCVLYRGRSQPQ